MKTRHLGRQGPVVGEVGLGCWQFGGAFGPMSEATAMEVMRSAVASGVDFFDTADVYGGGCSEEWIGKFLRSCDRRVFVATKYGRAGSTFPDGYSEAGMRAAIEASLERLGVETLDLLQLHCIPGRLLRQGEVFDWLRRAQRDGLIRHFGASVESVEEGLLCLGQEGLLSLQIIFNIFRQKPAEELLPRAQERGVGIIVRLPLASGLLAGKFGPETVFPESDHRHFNRDGERFNVGETFAGLPFAKGVELAGKIRQRMPDGLSMAQASMRWILDHEAVSVVIPGASSAAQAQENTTVSDLSPLPVALHEDLAGFHRSEVREHIRGPY